MSDLFHPNDFNTGLFDCLLDPESSLEGLFCPWCTTSSSYHMLARNHRSMDFGMCCITAFLDFFLWGVAHGVAACITRAKLRARFQFAQSDDFCDRLLGFFFSPCSACQVYRELSIRSLWPGGILIEGPYIKSGLVLPQHQTMMAPMFPPPPSYQQPVLLVPSSPYVVYAAPPPGYVPLQSSRRPYP
jgi:Cys-rich protein (TIGR01571 family)